MKNTFTICFRSKEFVGPPLTLPITSPVTPYGPGSVSSPGLLPQQPPDWYPASTLPPADPAQRGSQAGTPASAQNLSEVPAVAQKARQGLQDLPVTALTPSPLSPFLTPSVPATLASGGSPRLPATLQDSCTCHTPRLTHSSHRCKYTSLPLPLQAVTQKSPPPEAFPSTTEETSTPT